MKRLFITVLCAVFSFTAFAEPEFSFENEVSSDIRNVERLRDEKGNRHTKTDFAGIKEKMSAEVKTDRFDAGVESAFVLDDFNERNFGFDYDEDDFDYYIEFRPITKLTLGIHDNIFADASALPIYEDGSENISFGNIGSSGFSAIARPINGLRIGATLPFGEDNGINWAGKKNHVKLYEDEAEIALYEAWLAKDHPFTEEYEVEVYRYMMAKRGYRKHLNIGFGAIYDGGNFQIGATAQNVLNRYERRFGAYGTIRNLFGLVEGLNLNAGYGQFLEHRIEVRTYNEEYDWFYTKSRSYAAETIDDLSAFGGITYNRLFNASVTYENDRFNAAAEVLSNLSERFRPSDDDDDKQEYDLYAAATAGVNITDMFSLSLTGRFLKDFSHHGRTYAFNDQGDLTVASKSHTAKNIIGGSIKLTVTPKENHEFSAGFDIDTCHGQKIMKFPVSYVYSF